MARRRMFSLDIIDTDKFLDMPISAQGLYFHLGMRADDDGFVASPKRVTAVAGCSSDDLKILIDNGFVIGFDTGIVIIKDWRINNYIQKDRYKTTKYIEELQKLEVAKTGSYVYRPYTDSTQNCIQNDIQDGYETDTQVRLGKINNIYCRASTTVDDKKVLDIKQNQSSDTIKQIVDYLNQKTGKNFKPTTAETKRHINARLKDGFTVNDFFTVIDTKVNQWLNSPDMCKYLRPSTLFSTKFESYLNENGGNRTEGQRQQGQAQPPQERIYNDDSDDFHDWSKEKLDSYIESVKDEPQTV